MLKAGKSLNFHTLPFFEAPSGGTRLDIVMEMYLVDFAGNGSVRKDQN